MIYLSQIELTGFKGIDSLRCDFDDLTALVGVNNAGKTSVLQAVHLLISTLPTVVNQSYHLLPNIEKRQVDFESVIRGLGLPHYDWLISDMQAPFKIKGTFWNGCIVTIEMHGPGRFCFTVKGASGSEPTIEASPEIEELKDLSTKLFRPPGMLPARESMLTAPVYKQRVSEGTGDIYWRNSIWWTIQTDGPETFQPVQALVEKHFPGIDIRLPTLGDSTNPPDIRIRYKESEREQKHFDIAQSGAGLHTFLSLAQIIRQSTAKIILLDEPDSHLHASQQDTVVQLLTSIATQDDRQVILATHSPEIIARIPDDCIRWLERGSPVAEGADRADLWDRLGASANAYLSKSDFPEVVVYIEGDDDRPIIERLIQWCRKTHGILPKTAVVRHKEGRFKASTLHGISRVASEVSISTRVVGVRDLDWYYEDCSELPDGPPKDEPDKKEGPGYVLLTLQCKELENLMCDAELLFEALESKVPKDYLYQVIEEESQNKELIREWKDQVCHQIRDRFGANIDPVAKERNANEIFSRWRDDPATRSRLVRGKKLLGLIRHRIKDKYKLQCSNNQIMDNVTNLTRHWTAIAEAIFPSIKAK